MTTNYKILGQTAPTAGSETLNYTVPSSTSTMVKSINITNTSATADTFTLAALPVLATNTFVAVGSSSTTAVSSTDGITWTERTLPVSALWFSTIYGNSTFVATARNSTTAASSTDAITWTLRTLPVSASWQGATFGQVSTTTSNSSYIAFNNTIPGNSTVTIKAGYTLATGNGIRVTSTNGTSTFSTFGAEIS